MAHSRALYVLFNSYYSRYVTIISIIFSIIPIISNFEIVIWADFGCTFIAENWPISNPPQGISEHTNQELP
jgi:hypothetical protein